MVPCLIVWLEDTALINLKIGGDERSGSNRLDFRPLCPCIGILCPCVHKQIRLTEVTCSWWVMEHILSCHFATMSIHVGRIVFTAVVEEF